MIRKMLLHIPCIPPNVRKKIQSDYQIVDVFDFLDYHHDPSLFYSWCYKWSSYEFKPNERIVIVDSDSDYYAENSYGNNLYNFFVSCRQFSLPTEFFIYASGSFNKHIEIQHICREFNLTSPTILEFLHLPANNSVPLEIKNLDFSESSINRLYSCMNGRHRSYRSLLLCHLYENDLLKYGYVTWHFRQCISHTDMIAKSNKGLENITPSVPLRTTVPVGNWNDWFAKSPLDIKLFKNHINQFCDQNFNYPELENIDIWNLQPEFLQKSLINLVTESAFHYPSQHPSEKLIKPILTKRGFILVGASGLLNVLREFGFKTFDSVWDESYDSITDASQRLLSIVNLVNDLSKQDLNTLIKQVQPIVEFNFEHYKNNFIGVGMHRWFSNGL